MKSCLRISPRHRVMRAACPAAERSFAGASGGTGAPIPVLARWAGVKRPPGSPEGVCANTKPEDASRRHSPAFDKKFEGERMHTPSPRKLYQVARFPRE